MSNLTFGFAATIVPCSAVSASLNMLMGQTFLMRSSRIQVSDNFLTELAILFAGLMWVSSINYKFTLIDTAAAGHLFL